MLVSILPPPGIIKETTNYAPKLRWVDSNLIRFRFGLPEHIGGWTKLIETTLDGPARSILPFKELDGMRNIAFGTACSLWILQGGTLYDITPYSTIDTALGADPFASTSGSTTITVTDTAHSATAGDRVTFSGATAFNGVTVSGTYEIVSVIDDDTYTITDDETASGTGSGGGASVLASYTLSCAPTDASLGLGWGTGKWGEGFWGDARVVGTVTIEGRVWSLDNWGEDLVAAPREGAVYLWDSSTGTGTRAALISGPPSQVGFIAVSEERHLIAFGAHDGTVFNPMLIRWSTQEDYTNWTPAITNTAGDYLLDDGTRIIAIQKARGQILVFTDTAVYSMQYIGPPYVFGFSKLGTNCGIIGPNAVTSIGGTTVWVSGRNFYIYDGSIRVLDCPVQTHFFDDLNYVQAFKVNAGLNSDYTEIFFFYQSLSSTDDVDKYVKWNYKDNLWDVGVLGRTAWVPPQIGFTNPIATAPDGTIYQHENGYNDDTAPINSWIETGVLELEDEATGDGDNFMYLARAIPDNTLSQGKRLEFTVYGRRYPNDEDEITKGAYIIEYNTNKVDLRHRARQFRFRFESDDIDNRWRLGKWRVEVNPDGAR